MPPEQRAAVIAELFDSAIECPPGERQAWLDRRCGADSEVRAEVESLLNAAARPANFLDGNASEALPELEPARGLFSGGEAIRDYTIVSLIGKGGMGEVYLAQDRRVTRHVALKLVRGGIDRETLTRRFRREQQLLAGLNHPNIAQLYDSGVTNDGIPYFAMEYIEGTRLDQFVEERALPLRERLHLFQKICAAVAYAHQHLVVHRDIKPANVLVAHDGEPKLLDFGIAKLLDDVAAEEPEPTVTMHRMLTPEYASPEQVRGDRISMATDVYSLGVVLYELLTGRKPYRLTNRPEEVARAITQQAPERPSVALSSNQKSEIRNQKSLLRGDLDNIVLMAMRKEPERRYASVALLSDDIRRHLEGRTVLARKDTFGYRAGKFISRNKAGVAAAALVFLSLAGGIVATTYEARRAHRRFDEVRRLANSLMFEIHDSVQHLQGSTPTRRLIVDRALQYLDSLNAEGGADTSLQRELATAYEKVGDIQGNPYNANLGDSDGALASYRKATAIREAVAKTERSTQAQIELGRSYRGLGDVMEQKGDIAECLKNYRHSAGIFEKLAAAAPDDRAVLDELARAYETLGDGLGRTADTAERLRVYQQVLPIRERLLQEHPAHAKQQRSYAVALMKVAAVPAAPPAEAVGHMQRAIAMLEALAAADPTNARARREVGYAYYQFGRIQNDAGDHPAALKSRQRALDIRQEIAAQDMKNQQARFDLATAHGELAESYVALGAPDEAMVHGRQSLQIFLDLTAADPGNAVYRRNLGICFERLGAAHLLAAGAERAPDDLRAQRLAEARDWYRKGFDLFLDLRTRGALMPTDISIIDTYGAKIAEIEQALARLDK